MAWIRWVPEEEAEGRLAELYDQYGTPHGMDHILKIHSLNPESLDGHYRYYAHLMRGPSGLSRAEREMIAVVVSQTNDCFY
jgi:alkylhydroperoxidase family enzyme